MDKLASSQEIEKIVDNILIDSKCKNILPTPVDKIVEYAELKVNKGIDLSKIHPSFIAKNFDLVYKVIKKVRGLIDFRKKEIYLDLNQKQERQDFVKLHETGHNVLPWQKAAFNLADDDYTLSPDVKEELEREANYFASSTLFQLDRFNEEAMKLPLELPSAMLLAKKFGSSVHAALRRYVEFSNKRCALLVLETVDLKYRQRNYFQSNLFTKELGYIPWPEFFNSEFPFINDIRNNRIIHKDGQINISLSGNKKMSLTYHFFNNRYNFFVFLLPIGEINKSKTTIHY
jgi:Zn-dependent peptidase ImmA (M78 family)